MLPGAWALHMPFQAGWRRIAGLGSSPRSQLGFPAMVGHTSYSWHSPSLALLTHLAQSTGGQDRADMAGEAQGYPGGGCS